MADDAHAISFVETSESWASASARARAAAAGGAAASKAASKEYETEVHFRKCYGVMTEVFEAHGNLESSIPSSGFRFLDLGCAPGGFSSFLLDDPRCSAGFGVTLPSLSGGFPVRVRSDRFLLQHADLFELGPRDLLAPEVHICICDAQYLRNNISWDDQYRGVHCRSKQHGVWALIAKQFWLGLTRVATGGVFIFRFGWREPDYDDPATNWYKKCTMRLFTLLHDLFGQVNDVKSDVYNALQSSFYVCCAGFHRRRFEERQVAKLLGTTFNYLITTDIQDSNELEIFAEVDKIRTQELDDRIYSMLDRINKVRLINEGSRNWHSRQEAKTEDPWAMVFLAPVPEGMSAKDLDAAFQVFGRVQEISMGDGEHEVEASVRFAHREHARVAATALRRSGLLGAGVRLWLREEVEHEWPRALAADAAEEGEAALAGAARAHG